MGDDEEANENKEELAEVKASQAFLTSYPKNLFVFVTKKQKRERYREEETGEETKRMNRKKKQQKKRNVNKKER